MQPEESEPSSWTMVLDRELTAQETLALTSMDDRSAVFSYLRSGRPLEYASFLENAPPEYYDHDLGLRSE